MAEFGFTLTHQDGQGITTAETWMLDEEDYGRMMKKAIELFGPSHGSLMADTAGTSEISKIVRDNSVGY